MENISPSNQLYFMLSNIKYSKFSHIKQYIAKTKERSSKRQSIYTEIILTDIVWLLQQNKQSLAGNIIGLLSNRSACSIVSSCVFQTILKNKKLNITQIAPNNPSKQKILKLETMVKTKKNTHTLGISDKLRDTVFQKMYPDSKSKAILGEGAWHANSILWMINSIEKYITNTTNNQLFQEIFDAFMATYNICNYLDSTPLNKKAYKLLAERALSGKMTIILTGTIKHSFTVALYKGFIIISNTGKSVNDFSGISIYKLTADNEIVTDTLRDLIEIIPLNCKSIYTTYNKINVLTSALPIDIPKKQQKYGTCTFVNQKVLLQGLLLVQYATSKATSDVSAWEIFKKNQTIRKQSYDDYKAFTTFLRQQAIFELLHTVKTAPAALRCSAIESLAAVVEKYKDRLNYLKKLQEYIKNSDQRVIVYLFMIAQSTSIFKFNKKYLLSEKANQTLGIATKQYKNLPSNLKLST